MDYQPYQATFEVMRQLLFKCENSQYVGVPYIQVAFNILEYKKSVQVDAIKES